MYGVRKATKQEIAEYLKRLRGEAWEESEGDTDSGVWEKLYEKVFSPTCSVFIYKEWPDFEWSDLDTTYQEDVCAFIDAFCEYAGVGPW